MQKIFEARAGLLFTAITSVLFCGAAFGVAQTQITHNKQAIATYAEDHDILLQLRADISWIRSRMAAEDRILFRIPTQQHEPGGRE